MGTHSPFLPGLFALLACAPHRLWTTPVKPELLANGIFRWWCSTTTTTTEERHVRGTRAPAYRIWRMVLKWVSCVVLCVATATATAATTSASAASAAPAAARLGAAPYLLSNAPAPPSPLSPRGNGKSPAGSIIFSRAKRSPFAATVNDTVEHEA